MRITSIPPRELMSKYVHAKEKMPSPAASLTSGDKVELTGNAQSFSATLKVAKDAISADAAAKSGKVDAIKKQIENNEYFVPGYRVAEKILGE
jgi:anti-sigma28 factor (negative regulator of flagellin synthesis)